jgi:hypothetical protein
MFQKPFQKSEFSSRVIITFQVMAVPRVSPRDPHAIRPPPEGGENKLGTHAGRTGHPYDPEVGRILEPAHTSQVCRAVTAPVAEKGSYLRFPITHNHTSRKASTFPLRSQGLVPLSPPTCHAVVCTPVLRSSLLRRVQGRKPTGDGGYAFCLKPSSHIPSIMAMIWPSSNPFKFKAPERQDDTQSPHPLHSTGLISALPASGPSALKEGAP